jgi:predicted nucleic acid-binding protein
MTPFFADTFYFQARLNRHDQYHARVVAWSQTQTVPLVTTELVLVELANSLSASHFRPFVRDYFSLLRRTATVLPANHSRLEKALALYHQHADKTWSLTDCLSFVAMHERRITAALTGDHHFVQAGFAAIFA